MEKNNKHKERMLEEAIRKIMTFDQEACFESIRKQMLERIRKDRDSNQ